jgi:Heme oxygenase
MTMASPTTETMKPPCPHSTIGTATAATDDHSSSSDDLIQSCPAFEQGRCPFSQCSDEDEIRKMLLEIPASHFENQRGDQFKTILQSLHATKSELLGMATCPVANLLGQQPRISFTEAVDDFSLAAIMSKMAEEYQKQSGGDTTSSEPTMEMARKLLTLEPTPTDGRPIGLPAAVPPPSTGTNPRATLSASFKNGTASAHQAAENVHFVANFIRGKIDRQLYADLVSQLGHVYAALEDRLDQCSNTDPVLAQFRPFHEKLRRTKALAEDVDFWGRREIFPETVQYADRLRSLDPLLLLAHSYTRYLGA